MPAPDHLDTESPAVESLTRLLTRAVRTVTARIEEVLRAEGLSVDQWLVVEALAERRGLTMAEIAARTMATGPTLTRIVDRLVMTAVAYREVDATDRRRVQVYLSPRGRSTYRRVAAKVRAVEQEVLAAGADPTGVRTTLETLAGPL